MLPEDRQAGAEIEVSQEMIRAGAEAFAESGVELADAQTEDRVADTVRLVYLRMAAAQKHVPQPATR